jgi:L-amino acid N-acyltransferase YncA
VGAGNAGWLAALSLLMGKALMASITLRPARLDDAAAIAEIYNQGVRGRGATFETEERTPEERSRWLAAHDAQHPCLVATVPGGDSDRVVAWASTGEYRSRDCYRGIAEFSVYVHQDWRGKGVGKALLAALILAAEAAGLWKLVSRIFPENAGSRALCAWAGFREVGIYERHAQLDGVWKDCVIVERLLSATVADGARP